jgi:endonuclease I/V8-like Glu-specific endopeptidase
MEFPLELLRSAGRRYLDRAGERDEAMRLVNAGRMAEANPPERVERRQERLQLNREKRQLFARAVIGGAGGVAGIEGVSIRSSAARAGVLERVLGPNNLLDASFIAGLVAASKTVARIHIGGFGGRSGFGTGFLVSPRLLMTNNHVLPREGVAGTSVAEFNFERARGGGDLPSVSFQLDPATFFVTSPFGQLDYSLVAIGRPLRDGAAAGVEAFGWNRLIGQQGKVLRGEPVNIIQHPGGGEKRLVLQDNQLVDILELGYLHYLADTEPGSSGSPVFNNQWELVGLHHSGVPRTDAAGNVLRTDGGVADDNTPDDLIEWVANEGVRVSFIVEDLKKRNLSAAQARLRDQVLDASLSPVEVAPLIPPRDDAAPHRPAAGVTFTVPLQVTMTFGTPVLGPAAAPGAAPAPPTPSVGGGSGVFADHAGAGNGGQGRGGAADDDRPVINVRDREPDEEPDEPAEPSPDFAAAMDALRAAEALPYYDEAADRQNRDAYYQGIPATGKLYDRLSKKVTETHTKRPAYKPSVEVYPFVDLHPDKKLYSIYSGKPFAPESLIRADERLRASAVARFRELMRAEGAPTESEQREQLQLLEESITFNCEHVVPQSWFLKKEPMRGDVHHLFACEAGCNSFRGNFPYFDFPDFQEAARARGVTVREVTLGESPRREAALPDSVALEVVRSACGRREKNGFEPPDSGKSKGTVARATLYFTLRYPGQINQTAAEYTSDRLATLVGWHKKFPVGLYEKHRNAAVFARQGNRNPLIDHPEWVDRIDFTQGLGPA